MPASEIITANNSLLPPLPDTMLPAISQLTDSLGIPREVLAPEEEIAYAWRDLPRELVNIPQSLRGELIARMCVAVSTGLFDGAINYAWNATVIHLKSKVKEFGLPMVGQTLERNFEEKHLADLQDSELLDLSLKLGLISEDGFFFLNQCRDTRNNFSAAHPTIGKINDREFTTFLNRCIRYSLAAEAFPRGVDVGAFISAVKGDRFIDEQLNIWIERLRATHEAQRELLFGTIHGIYCDPATPEQARLNALNICSSYKDQFSERIKSHLIDKHSNYLAKGETERHSASQQFFEKLELLSLLNESERHSLISNAVSRLWSVHQAMNNFYNEPPFAERLRSISEQDAIPDTIKEKYVHAVVGCRIGNQYGVCRAASDDYDSMIRDFSPKEVSIVLGMPENSCEAGKRIKQYTKCRSQFGKVLNLIDPDSVSSSAKAEYDKYRNESPE